MTTPAPSQISMVVDKHPTTLVNCLQNVVHIMMLLYFLEVGMFWICFTANHVSPSASWKGFAYNLWFCSLVYGLMLAFKDTLECLILFENSKRNRDGKKEATTTITVNKACAHIKHVDSGSTNTTLQTLAILILQQFLNKANEAETAQNEKDAKEATTPSSTTEDETAQNEKDAKEATTPSSTTEDEIKQDAASASSSARSTADTSDVLN